MQNKTRSDTQNLTAGYALIQGFHWMNFAVILGFSSVYLLDAGFSNTNIGLIIAIAGIVSAIMQPLIASYADKPSSISLKKLILIFGGVMLAIAAGLLIVRGRAMFFTALFYGAAIMFLQLLTPLINSLGTQSINSGKKLNFGASRGIGSIAYAVASFTLGRVVAGFGAISVPIVMGLIFCALTGSLALFPFQKPNSASTKAIPKSGGNPLSFFRHYKRFCFTLCGCVFLYISHLLLDSFIFQIVETKGGGSQEMGVAMALAAMFELPTMFGFAYMLKKAQANFWIRVSGVFYVMKTAGTLFVCTVTGFYLVQTFQMLSGALLTVSSVYYVNSVMDEQDAIKGQAYMTMTYTLGSVLASLFGGMLIDRAGVNAMLLFATVSAGAGMVIVMASAGNKKA